MVDIQMAMGLDEVKECIRAAVFRLGSSVEIAGKVERDEGLYVLVIEKFYLRTSSYASLTIVATGDDATSRVTAIASGSGDGFLNLSYGVKKHLEQDFLEEMESCSR